MATDDSSIIKIGPVVSPVGEAYGVSTWDYKGCNKITQIFISHDEYGVKSIQFQYEHNGALLMSKCHGKNTEQVKYDVVTVNQRTEYITSVSFYKPDSNSISSLEFTTNLSKHGPFGGIRPPSNNKVFYFYVGSQFWGFYGSSDCNGLRCIGIYLKPTTTLALAKASPGQNVVVPKKEA